MLRRYGLFIGMFLALTIFVGDVTADQASVFNRQRPDYRDRYGIMINGGGGLFTMKDINDYRLGTTHTDAGNEENALLGIGYGLAILYRSEERLRISIGLNSLGQDKTYAEWAAGAIQKFEQIVRAGELYVQYEYLIPMNEDHTFNLSLNLGPAFYAGSLDRSGTVGVSFTDANGRGMGFRGGLGGQWMFSDTYGIHFMLGYRYAKIGEIKYEDRNGVEQTVYWGSGNRKFELDFSGAFLEIGLRMYFVPSTGWISF